MKRGCGSGSIPASPRSAATISSAPASSRSRRDRGGRSGCASRPRSTRAPAMSCRCATRTRSAPSRSRSRRRAWRGAPRAAPARRRPPALDRRGRHLPLSPMRHREARLDGAIAIEPPRARRSDAGQPPRQWRALLPDRRCGRRRRAARRRRCASVAVLWDRSLSRADDDRDEEIAWSAALSGAGAAAGDRADPVRQRRRRAGAAARRRRPASPGCAPCATAARPASPSSPASGWPAPTPACCSATAW